MEAQIAQKNLTLRSSANAYANDIMSLFLQLNAELGLTVIIVTHDPTIAARCPRRIVMRDGQVFGDNTLRGVEVA
ncbi:hypothetical protein [Agrobacterium sp. NPDC089420]|uniref:hypothetical protein n=1 Tax=Agrobacterium sp. NPDC089420 TaxID=3363918 RepID=UPI00384C8191